MNSPAPGLDRRRLLAALVEGASHLLPGQRPIESFVHHNTLHCYEELPFEQAVVTAAQRFGAQAFMPEAKFREAWQSSRILDRDIDLVLQARIPESDLAAGMPGMTESEAVRRLMLFLPADCGGPALEWRLTETDVLTSLPDDLPRDCRERIATSPVAKETWLPQLWAACQAAAAEPEGPTPGPRPRDLHLAKTGQDTDGIVHPVLIRWCGAYLDHGQSHWPMPAREQGFYRSVLTLLASPSPQPTAWLRRVARDARNLLAKDQGAVDCVADVLADLGVAEDDLDEVITATLLALPGWPGMFGALTARPDLAPGATRPTALMDYLAIRLLLDRAALAAPQAPRSRADDHAGERAWRLFHAALLVGMCPTDKLEDGALQAIADLLDRWPVSARGALWQLAYERRYRVGILDAVLAHHQRTRTEPRPKPRAQVVTCIDDREESLRRHLEELHPAWHTFGYAGFYGVSMAWRGLGEAHSVPLCPAGVVPRHTIEERPKRAHDEDWSSERQRRARRGQLGKVADTGSATLVRGGLLSLAGLAALVPMVRGVLNPGAQVTKAPPIPTTVTVFFNPDEPTADGKQLGFTRVESANIVAEVLKATGLVTEMADLVVFLGHGSCSMNNPHEAAHDCGACGGGRGGPNARVFARMANDAEVRALLRPMGVDIPDRTRFVGGYHNTADDNIEYYDLERIPESHKAGFAALRADLEEARRRDAHERCRRFESAPLDITLDDALRHVVGRANDLAQPRPEYGHATNALCMVGRRAWSRGLFLDRRVFLTSYDPAADPDGDVLEGLLASVGPVGAGINLEYYFSFVDRDRYGCNTKLPHNITGLVGVMDGHASDLRTGLPWQMVEIHEPVRLLNIIEAKPEQLLAILARQPALAQLILHRWILVVAFDTESGRMWFFDEDGFQPHFPETRGLPEVGTSADWYRGHREHLSPASIVAGRMPLAEAAR